MSKLKLFIHFHSSSQLKAYLFKLQKLFTYRTPMRPTHPCWTESTHFHTELMKTISSSIEHVSSWSYMKISTSGFMFKILVFGWNFTFYTWNSLLRLFLKFVCFSIFPTHIRIRSGEKIQKIWKFTFEILECFKHF